MSIPSLDFLDLDMAKAYDAGELRYDPSQPRKPNGQFGSTGGASTSGDDDVDVDSGDSDDYASIANPGELDGDIPASALSAQQESYLEDELDGIMVEAVVDYTGAAHYDTNKVMRGAPPPPITNEDIAFEAEALGEYVNMAVLGAPPIDKDIVVYRGVSEKALGLDSVTYGDQQLDELIGTSFIDKGIVSTSVDAAQARGFTVNQPVVLAVRVPKGSQALYVDKMSTHPGEREVLLPSKTKFSVVAIERPKSGTLKNHAVIIVDAETLPFSDLNA